MQEYAEGRKIFQGEREQDSDSKERAAGYVGLQARGMDGMGEGKLILII